MTSLSDSPAETALSDTESEDGAVGKALVPQGETGLVDAVAAAKKFIAASHAKATLRAYQSDWCDFISGATATV